MTGPVLLTFLAKGAQKNSVIIIAQTQLLAAPVLPLGFSTKTLPTTITDLEQQLGVQTLVTPATGNSLAMAIDQAAADSKLDGLDLALMRITASINGVIKYSGLLHLEDQLAPDHCVHALANVKGDGPR